MHRIFGVENLNGGRAKSGPFGFPSFTQSGANLHLSEVPHAGLKLATCVPGGWLTGCRSFMQHGRSRTMNSSASAIIQEYRGRSAPQPWGCKQPQALSSIDGALARPAVDVSSRPCPFLAWEAVQWCGCAGHAHTDCRKMSDAGLQPGTS